MTLPDQLKHCERKEMEICEKCGTVYPEPFYQTNLCPICRIDEEMETLDD